MCVQRQSFSFYKTRMVKFHKFLGEREMIFQFSFLFPFVGIFVNDFLGMCLKQSFE